MQTPSDIANKNAVQDSNWHILTHTTIKEHTGVNHHTEAIPLDSDRIKIELLPEQKEPEFTEEEELVLTHKHTVTPSILTKVEITSQNGPSSFPSKLQGSDHVKLTLVKERKAQKFETEDAAYNKVEVVTHNTKNNIHSKAPVDVQSEELMETVKKSKQVNPPSAELSTTTPKHRVGESVPIYKYLFSSLFFVLVITLTNPRLLK